MKYHRLLISCVLMGLTSCAQPGTNAATGLASASASATADPSAVGPNTLNVADAAIAGGDPSMALSVAQSVLQNDPNSVDALIHEADAYYALQRCPDAIAAYTLALKTSPGSSIAETGLGRCYIKTDPKAAEAALLLAVRDDPGNAAALNDLGIARDLQGNFAGAIAPYQQALLAQPGLTAAEVNLGLSLALSGNGAEALQYLGPLATSPQATPKIRQNYAAALVASGRIADARQVLSVDLPPDQIDSAMAGFNAVIAGAQPVAAAPAAIETTTAVPTMPVAIAPLQAAPPATARTVTARPSPALHASMRRKQGRVQLASFNSHADAQSTWIKMLHSMPLSARAPEARNPTR